VKLSNNYLTGLLAIAAVFFVLMGCTRTYTMKKDEMISILQTGSPLKGIAPKTFAFKEFRNARGRGMDDPYLVLRFGVEKFVLEQPTTAVVAMAIRKELERNGHTCITYSPQSKSDFLVEGSLYKYEILLNIGAYAEVGANITVSSASAENRLLTKTYEGDYRMVKSGGIGGGKWKTLLNQALLAMLKELSTDPDLVAFLEK